MAFENEAISVRELNVAATAKLFTATAKLFTATAKLFTAAVKQVQLVKIYMIYYV